MAGVLPAWQGQGLGLALKLAQRQAILEQGLTDWVTWTYDPLQRTNAVFNIHRLGAVCNTYKANWYGEMRDGLNAGTPSDRCQVDLVVKRGAGGEGRGATRGCADGEWVAIGRRRDRCGATFYCGRTTAAGFAHGADCCWASGAGGERTAL